MCLAVSGQILYRVHEESAPQTLQMFRDLGVLEEEVGLSTVGAER